MALTIRRLCNLSEGVKLTTNADARRVQNVTIKSDRVHTVAGAAFYTILDAWGLLAEHTECILLYS